MLARFSFKLNLTLLGVFVAANLLPPQALLIPIYRAFHEIPVPTGSTTPAPCSTATSA